MFHRFIPLAGMLLLQLPAEPTGERVPVHLELERVERVWDQAPHNAFTDLIRFRDSWYLVFREAGMHGVPPAGTAGGRIRVLRSTDPFQWTSVALLDFGFDQDLRDPKLSIRPDGVLVLLCAAAPTASPERRQSLVFFSRDGTDWKEPQPVAEPDVWLWRLTWHRGMARGVGYGRRPDRRHTRLYESPDALRFRVTVERLYEEGYPNEASLLFLEDDRALCLLRRDGPGQDSALLGLSSPPYTRWSWRDLGRRIGGPALIRLPEGPILTAGRSYEGGTRTTLSWLDVDNGRLVERLVLPSGGDSSYPGLVWHENRLWVSYYSSHEGRAAIYLAQVKVQEDR